MARLRTSAIILILVGVSGWTALGQPSRRDQTLQKTNAPGATREEFERWMTELSNWGRWGQADELGAANLITEAKRREALGLAKNGTTVSLGHDLVDDKGSDVANPFGIHMIISLDPPLVRDRLNFDYHGGFFTHLDALCHVVYKDKIYNGLDFRQTVTDDGCARLGITGLKDGLLTRAVLIDVPRLRGVSALEGGTRVYRGDIEAWEKQAGVKVGSGDALLVRTGRWARRAKLGPWNVAQNAAGLHASTAPWIKARGVAFLGGDVGTDVVPSMVEGVNLPMHTLLIAALGINLLDNQDLEAVAETAAKLNRWEFMLSIAPVPVTGGTGFPLNALAVF